MTRLERHRWLAAGLLAVFALAILGAAPVLAGAKARNVIVLIADGCASEQHTFARWFKGAPLSYDPFQVGAIKTYIADSVIADSAPAASAFATGVRTNDKFISVGPNQNTLSVVPPPPEEIWYKPMATVLEGARLLKKSTGIVATSRVTHATPAAYIAHAPSRGDEDDIMEQAVHQGIDVVFGGGKRHLVLKEFKGRRTDGDNLYEHLKNWGYQIVETREQMQGLASGRVYGMFAASHMDPEIDRPRRHPGQPTLAEMTRKAIEILARNQNGFFLMVEGSQVDWACHANDPAYLLSDLLAFDTAVQAALDFARKDGSTLVLAMSDHNTGGFSIGNYATDGLYPQMKVEKFLEPFRKMQASSAAMMEQIEKDKTPARVQAVIKDGWALDITDEEARKILANAAVALGRRLFCHRRGALPEIHLCRLDHPRTCRRRRAAVCLRSRQARRDRGGAGHRPGLRQCHGLGPGPAERTALRRCRQGLRRRQGRRGQIRPGQPGGENRLPRQSRGAAGEQELPQAGRAHVPARGRGGVRPGHRPGLHPPAGGPDDPGRKGSPAQDRQLATQVDRLKAEGFPVRGS